ncbi:Urb2/Npa2 family-domain-containing protein [Halenospora varia]|nr:Urb2/Npa2 family-domain-containing protein [Halenospora varia]
MASKSRTAQEQLTKLEKASAPFADQLVEAAKFIGVDLNTLQSPADVATKTNNGDKSAIYHGREEWLLRWLLKKLQAGKDNVPRKTPMAWRLLNYLTTKLPRTIFAQLLVERKFTGILRQTLEEAQATVSGEVPTTDRSHRDSSSTLEDTSVRPSKKRKRSPELVGNTRSGKADGTHPLLEAIYTTLSSMVKSTKAINSTDGGVKSAVFAAEYTKTALRTTAQEAATILGLWLSLSSEVLKAQDYTLVHVSSWLVPFVEIWEIRAPDDSDLLLFSQHATQSLLGLLRSVHGPRSQRSDWLAQLEQLVARNIILPAKSEKLENKDSALLSTLTKVAVIQETANAAIFFEIAIRSIQTHGARRRRPQDDAWLQAVFTTLKDAFLLQRQEENSQALLAMLESAIKHKVDLELPLLRQITSTFALPEGPSDWSLVAALINLDANVFLIPDPERDLLMELLARITQVSIAPEWSDIAEKIALDVVAPLMSEFAKARDLSGFISHWYMQLIEFEKLLQEERLFSMYNFGAWEDGALQTQLNKLLEPSLTLQQITTILDWLETAVDEHPNAVSVILEAIAGSISREENVDALGLRLYHIMFDNGRSEKLNARYKWRSWRIISQTMRWAIGPALGEAGQLVEKAAKPFDELKKRSKLGTLLEIYDGNSVSLDCLEMLRCACATWAAADKETLLEKSSKKVVLGFLEQLARDLKMFPTDLMGDTELGRSECGYPLNTLYRDIGWMTWSFTRCVLEEYPGILTLALELEGTKTFTEMLQNIFWIASASALQPEDAGRIEWLYRNPDAFQHLWMDAIQNDIVLNSPPIIKAMINVILCQTSNTENPLVKQKTLNVFSMKSLLKLPLEVLSKDHRERVLTIWSAPPKDKLDAEDLKSIQSMCNPTLLSLKIKVMRRPTYYEGMCFQDFIRLVQIMSNVEDEDPKATVALLKEYVRLTIVQMTGNMDQVRDRTYISDAISDIKKILKSASSSKKEGGLAYPCITLVDTTLSVLRSKSMVLNDLDIISTTKLEKLSASLKEYLLDHFKILLKKAIKSSSKSASNSSANESIALLCTMDALAALGVTSLELQALEERAKTLANSESSKANDVLETGNRLDTFMTTHSEVIRLEDFGEQIHGNISTVYGRQSILEKVRAATSGKVEESKLLLLHSIFGAGFANMHHLDKLLAARYVIASCEDTRRPRTGDDDDKDFENQPFDLSFAYSALCGHLWKATDLRQFCLISETMELMLRTKGRSVSQWNIDSTLGSITIICSRNGPSLRSNNAGTIYLHLCHLMQAVLVSHRLKLQGHFHIVVQVMQTLLRCLFTPLPHSTTKTTKFLVPPPWLSSPKYQLGAKHAAAYARLVTLICDPSVSSVTRSQHNNLNSATDKAKGMAAQHMQYVLTSYIKLQLEMRMAPEIREKMIPGLYAIFDTTNMEMRRMISDSLDASGRAVYGTLFRDYQKFGKWKGS